MKKRIFISVTILFLFAQTVSTYGQAQIKTMRWSNKDKGTFVINPHARGLRDSTVCTISVRLFELSSTGCDKITGKISINGKEYEAYDSSEYADSEGDKVPDNILYLDLKPGIYSIKAFVNNDYFPVKTGELELRGNALYSFNFYLIRKKRMNVK